MGQKINSLGLRLNVSNFFLGQDNNVFSLWSSLWYADQNLIYSELFLNDRLIQKYIFGCFSSLSCYSNTNIIRQKSDLNLFIKVVFFNKNFNFESTFLLNHFGEKLIFCIKQWYLTCSKKNNLIFFLNFYVNIFLHLEYFNFENFFNPTGHSFNKNKSLTNKLMSGNFLFFESEAAIFSKYLAFCFSENNNLTISQICDVNWFLKKKKMGLTGIRIKCSGRLKGVEMAKSEVFSQGSVPLHRFEYLVDYGFSSVVTTFGLIGISVWCFKKGAIHSC